MRVSHSSLSVTTQSFTHAELKQLAHELRWETIRAVSRTGGHLGSSLGVIELTTALHYVFDAPEDRILHTRPRFLSLFCGLFSFFEGERRVVAWPDGSPLPDARERDVSKRSRVCRPFECDRHSRSALWYLSTLCMSERVLLSPPKDSGARGLVFFLRERERERERVPRCVYKKSGLTSRTSATRTRS